RASALATRAARAAGAAPGTGERHSHRRGRLDRRRAHHRGRHAGRPRAGAGSDGRAGGTAMSKNGKTKFIFVTGGVVSSLGKGVASASIGALLEARGLKVTLVKMDPYINVDPGTMSPFQHGEVFVTDDGAETDLELGHYERYVSTRMAMRNNFTTGQVYESVITKQRRARRRDPVRGAGRVPRRGARRARRREAPPLHGRPPPAALAADRLGHQEPEGPGRDRDGREVRRFDRFVQEPPRGAHARRDRQRVPRQGELRRLGEDRAGGAAREREERRRDPGADGLRPSRHRGEDPGGAPRARERDPLPRHLLRHAD